jgi:hypothetical protein
MNILNNNLIISIMIVKRIFQLPYLKLSCSREVPR